MVKRYFWLVLFLAAALAAALNIAAVFVGLKWMLGVLSPILAGLFLAVVLNIPMVFFERKVFRFKPKHKKARHFTAIAATYVLVFGLVGLFLWAVVPQLIDSVKGLVLKLPEYMKSSEQWITKLLLKAGIEQATADRLLTEFYQKITSVINGVMESLPLLIEKLFKGIGATVKAVFAIILSLYMLSDRDRLTAQLTKFVKASLPERAGKKLIEVATVSLRVFSKFIGGQVVESLLLGVMTFLGMLIFKLPYPLLIGAIIGLTNIVPLLGRISAARLALF